MIKKVPWYKRRGSISSKHALGRQPKHSSMVRRVRKNAHKNARIARAKTFNWPRGK